MPVSPAPSVPCFSEIPDELKALNNLLYLPPNEKPPTIEDDFYASFFLAYDEDSGLTYLLARINTPSQPPRVTPLLYFSRSSSTLHLGLCPIEGNLKKYLNSYFSDYGGRVLNVEESPLICPHEVINSIPLED